MHTFILVLTPDGNKLMFRVYKNLLEIIMSGPSSLVSTEWLLKHINDPSISVLDATWYLPNQKNNARVEYKNNHIPGAQYFDIDEIADLNNPLSHMLPSNEKMSHTLGLMGISNQDHIIVYDNSNFSSAARVWFMFRNFGHERVSILNGGFKKWCSDNGPVNDIIPHLQSTSYAVKKDCDQIRDINQIKENIISNKELIVDARARGRFLGLTPEPRLGSRSGHIPGSINVPFSELLNKDGTYKEPSIIKKIFKKNNVSLDKPIITSCGSGITACVLLFALNLIGHNDLALYDGSWSEWGSLTDMPIEK